MGSGVDGKADIWAFGCVLFEMLAGRRPFHGESTAGLIANILESQPEWSALADSTDALRTLLRQCLSKSPAERPANFTEIRRAVSAAARSLGGGPDMAVRDAAAVVRRPRRRVFRWPRLAPTMVVVAIVGSVAAAGIYGRWGGLATGGNQLLTDRDTIIVSDFTNRTGDVVFDGTLKLALAVALEQSPFIRVFPEARVREALPLMGRSADDLVTPAVARDIARREQLKALVAGSIASLGRHYVLTLEAIAAQTGDVMAREQAEVLSREQVLAGIERATRALRRKLGESLASISRFDTPLPRATTSSIDALRAYALALEGGQPIPRLDAIPHLERAIELDPQFAQAYAFLSSVYANTGQSELAPQFARRAFELRDRVSDRERFFIAWRYYVDAEQAFDKALALATAWTLSYPREPSAFNSVGVASVALGQYEHGLEAFRTTIRLDERMGLAYSNAAAALIALNQPDAALEVLQQATDRHLAFVGMNRIRFLIALVQNDAEAMTRVLEASIGRSSGTTALGWQAHASAFGGHVNAAHEQFRRGTELARSDRFDQVAAALTTEDAEIHALMGQCALARVEVTSPSAAAADSVALARAGRVLALGGPESDATRVMSDLPQRFPSATLTNHVTRPIIAALLALRSGKPREAVTLLEPVRPFDYVPAGELWPAYLRGTAYLQAGDPAAAAKEFSGVLEHRGVAPASVLYPLAHLGFARAAAMAGDADTARSHYDALFAMWSAADAGLAQLAAARAEHRRLNGGRR